MVSRIEFIENQKDYCNYSGMPFVLNNNGFCPNCGQDIVIYFIKQKLIGNEDWIYKCPYCHFYFMKRRIKT